MPSISGSILSIGAVFIVLESEYRVEEVKYITEVHFSILLSVH